MAADGWKQRTLADISTVVGGVAFPRVHQGNQYGEYPFFKVSDMNTPGNERELRVAANTVDVALLKALKARLHPPGTVVFPKVGAALLTNKRRRLVSPSGFDNNVMGLVATACDPDFLYLLMQTIDFSKFVQPGAVPSVNGTMVAKIGVLVPSLAEQRKIAAILSAVDDVIERTQAVIDQVQVVKRGMMQELFTRGLPGRHMRFKQTNMGAIPETWRCESLGALITYHNSGVYKKAALYGRGHNIVGVSDLYDCHSIDGQQFKMVPLTPYELTRYSLNEGDLIYGESSLVRAGIARTLPVTKRGSGTAFAWHTRRIRLDAARANAIFLHYLLDWGLVRRRVMAVATQTALTGITTKDFFSVAVLVPPIDEQMEIGKALASYDELMDKSRDCVDALRNVKSALMSVLLTGELRVNPDFEAE